MGYVSRIVLLVIVLCMATEPASAVTSLFEGFRGSFLRAFIAYAVLFISAHLATFLLMSLGFTKDAKEEEMAKSDAEDA